MLKPAGGARQDLYETISCVRAEMENRIKKRQLDLFAAPTATATLRVKQLRLWFAFNGLCPTPRGLLHHPSGVRHAKLMNAYE